jgi:hypothetical protein
LLEEGPLPTGGRTGGSSKLCENNPMGFLWAIRPLFGLSLSKQVQQLKFSYRIPPPLHYMMINLLAESRM